MALFEKLTNAEVVDCISDDERIMFIVKEGDIGAAIGKGGENVRMATEKFGAKLDIVEYSSDLKQFVRNLFAPLKLDDVWLKKYGDDLVVYIRVHPRLRKTIVGDQGKNINKMVNVLKRLTDATNIRVISDSRTPRKPYNKNTTTNRENKVNNNNNNSNNNIKDNKNTSNKENNVTAETSSEKTAETKNNE